MAKQKRFEEEDEEERVGCFTLLSRFVATTLVCVLVLLVGAYFFVGKEGFRSLLAGRMESAWNVPFHIEGSQALLRGQVLLTEVTGGAPVESVETGLRAAEATISGVPPRWVWTGGMRGIHRVTARDWELVFAQSAEGDWMPDPLARVHQWLNEWLELGFALPAPADPDTDGPPMVQPPLLPGAVLELREGTFRWVGADGSELARAEGVSVDVTPLRLPAREALHILLQIDSVTVANRRTASRLRVEVLRSEGVDSLLWHATR